MRRDEALMLSRRRVIRSLAGGAALGASGLSFRPAAALETQPSLDGTEFDLVIGEAPVNFTGRSALATAVNGRVPGPILRWRQGDTVTLNVANRLSVPTSIHWHGIRTPADMDGVPGLSFAGIEPGRTFTYRIKLHQHGTYWYHSHSGLQEQTGLYGALIVEPGAGYADRFDRDYVVFLSDWSDCDPGAIASNLKFQSDYYNYGQRTLGTFMSDTASKGLGSTIADRLAWGRMRMSPTDIADVTGAAYTYLLNGQPPAANWTALFRPGERVRLRFINGSSMSFFDVRIPGLAMSVVQADGNDVEPVPVDEFRIGTAETYDVIVQPGDRPYTIFAQSMDRSGYARGTLAPRDGQSAPVPPMDPRPLRTMADMGMGDMGTGGMAGMDMGSGDRKPDSMPGMKMPEGTMDHMQGMDMSSMPGMSMDHGTPGGKGEAAAKPVLGPEVDNVAMMPAERLDDPGDGLGNNGRRVLRYADLRAREAGADPRAPSREITLHLTGNMQRFVWGFDGKKFSEAEAIPLSYGERVRFTLVNDTMMEHPIHLHGLWSELDNGQDAYRPYKHTIIVKPGERLSYLVTADEKGRWAYHCHLLFHMEMGMFRTVVVT
jgi:CopA family copper-resistance protein